ncbi:YceI family protein [Pedobacter aquatilis]|uniref:YceI family protein n=1 Tax=Pedobacter aquatilis TaxID=351343 RepID=UPI0025B301FA|nr:YceI family protein [Pedobacter aquatilis]MDN3585060.1 YceI family protein [Pedobacter aquatilis]
MKVNKLVIAAVLLAFIILRCLAVNAQSYLASNVTTSFYSETPIEDIKASSSKTAAVVVATTGDFAFQVAIKSFEFEKKLMQEHFNENYLESNKYPSASFKGKINPNINWKNDGEYSAVAKGTLTIHGQSKARSIPVKIIVKNKQANISANFDVACTDHNIEIPTLVFTKIAKVINVKVNGNLTHKP